VSISDAIGEGDHGMNIDIRDQIFALLNAYAERRPASLNPFNLFLQNPTAYCSLGPALGKMLEQTLIFGRILIPRALATRSSLADAVRVASIGADIFGHGDPSKTEIHRLILAIRATYHVPEDYFLPLTLSESYDSAQEVIFTETVALLLADRLKGIAFETVLKGIKASDSGQNSALVSYFEGMSEYWVRHATALIDILVKAAPTLDLRIRAIDSLRYGLEQEPICWLFCRLNGREQKIQFDLNQSLGQCSSWQ